VGEGVIEKLRGRGKGRPTDWCGKKKGGQDSKIGLGGKKVHSGAMKATPGPSKGEEYNSFLKFGSGQVQEDHKSPQREIRHFHNTASSLKKKRRDGLDRDLEEGGRHK